MRFIYEEGDEVIVRIPKIEDRSGGIIGKFVDYTSESSFDGGVAIRFCRVKFDWTTSVVIVPESILSIAYRCVFETIASRSMTERKYRTKQEILKSFAGVSEPTTVMVFLEVLIDIRDILDNR